MKIKIKTRELARKLTNNRLVEIYGEDAIWRENIVDFQGLVYRDEVRDDANKYFEYYYNKIKEYVVYPFKEGDTYYTLNISDGKHEVQESVWDDVSEEMYRSNPDRRLFEKESVALMYATQIKNDKKNE